MILSAYLGVSGLLDVGYRFYTSAEVAVAARITSGIVDAGDGWYSVDATIPATGNSVRWDSTGTVDARAREYLDLYNDPWAKVVPNGYAAGTAGNILGNYVPPATASTIAVAVRDVSNATPADGSLGAEVKAGIGGSGGTGTTDWTVAERDQIRYRLGIDGNTSAPVTPPSLATQTTALAIKAKTDTLPPDPADASDIVTSFAVVNTKLDTIDDFVDTEVSAIKAKTDNLPTDPADASDIAASFTTVNTKLDAINGAVDTEIAAIKVKTDNLPVDPADASDIAASFTTVNTKLDTVAGYVDTEVASIKAVTDKLNTALEVDGAVYRYTTNALEQAPTGGGSVADPWNVPLPGSYPAGTAGKILGTNLDATVSSRLPSSSYVAPDNAGIAGVKAKTDNLPAQPAAVSNIPTASQNAAATRDVSNASPPLGSLGADVKSGIAGGGGSIDAVAIAEEVLKHDWNLISGEASESLLQAVRFLRNHWEARSDGTLIVYKENGTDIAWSRTIGVDVNAKPIVSVT